nr:MAG TPA: hypothetical protein [Caudoviricetes sp.]
MINVRPVSDSSQGARLSWLWKPKIFGHYFLSLLCFFSSRGRYLA